MPRWKKPTKEEVLENRRDLANRARSGELRLPMPLLKFARASA